MTYYSLLRQLNERKFKIVDFLYFIHPNRQKSRVRHFSPPSNFLLTGFEIVLVLFGC